MRKLLSLFLILLLLTGCTAAPAAPTETEPAVTVSAETTAPTEPETEPTVPDGEQNPPTGESDVYILLLAVLAMAVVLVTKMLPVYIKK